MHEDVVDNNLVDQEPEEVEDEDESMDDTMLKLLRDRLLQLDQQSSLDPLLMKMLNETMASPGSKKEVLHLLLTIVNQLQAASNSASTTAMPTSASPLTMTGNGECQSLDQYKILPDDSMQVVRKKQGN